MWKQGRLEPVETYVKNNKRGLGADKVKKKAVKVKPDHSNSSEGNDQQVVFSFGSLRGFLYCLSVSIYVKLNRLEQLGSSRKDLDWKTYP